MYQGFENGKLCIVAIVWYGVELIGHVDIKSHRDISLVQL